MSTPSIVELYSNSKCPRGCGECRDIESKDVSPRIKSREFPYIRIVQDCNGYSEYLRYYLFEEKKGPTQKPIQIAPGLSAREITKLLWPTESYHYYRPKDDRVYKVDDNVSYQCKVLGDYEWCLFLLPESYEAVNIAEQKLADDIPTLSQLVQELNKTITDKQNILHEMSAEYPSQKKLDAINSDIVQSSIYRDIQRAYLQNKSSAPLSASASAISAIPKPKPESPEAGWTEFFGKPRFPHYRDIIRPTASIEDINKALPAGSVPSPASGPPLRESKEWRPIGAQIGNDDPSLSQMNVVSRYGYGLTLVPLVPLPVSKKKKSKNKNQAKKAKNKRNRRHK